MRGSGAAELLDFWDWGLGQSPARRALGAVAAAHPETSWEELQEWPVGRRDRALLELRRRLFGAHLACVTSCPACGTAVELEFGVDDVCADTPADPAGGPGGRRLEVDGFTLTWRPPTCGDLFGLEGESGVEPARRLLMEHCVLEARHGDRPVRPDELSARAQAALAEAAAAADPQADSRLDLTCPDCGHGWLAAFDIGAFLWAEIEARARRLLDEVHRLALAYGWAESEVLAMGDARRWAYLELLGG